MSSTGGGSNPAWGGGMMYTMKMALLLLVLQMCVICVCKLWGYIWPIFHFFAKQVPHYLPTFHTLNNKRLIFDWNFEICSCWHLQAGMPTSRGFINTIFWKDLSTPKKSKKIDEHKLFKTTNLNKMLLWNLRETTINDVKYFWPTPSPSFHKLLPLM